MLFSVCPFTSGQNIKPPDHKLTESEIQGKTISELWLMRNSIFAKHGRPFKTYELHAYFMSQNWYKIRKNFKQSDLTETDVYNVNLLTAQEQKLLANNYPDGKTVNFNNIYNIFQYPKFSSDEQSLISKNGFVVMPTDKQQLFHIYENNDYLGIPSFITVDMILQLYHLYFDMTLRNIEQNYLYVILDDLLKSLITENLNLLKTETNKDIIDAVNFNLAYLGVAEYFLSGDEMNLHGTMAGIAKEEISLCESLSPWTDSPLMKRKMDYTQYKPRGHYTRSEKLKKFFKSMMWLGNAGIEVTNDQNILSSIIMTDLLYNKSFKGKKLIDMWKDIYEPTAFYVGVSDDTGPEDIKKQMDNIFPEVTKLEDYNNHTKLQTLAENLPKEKISGHGKWAIQKKQFRFMGRRFVPDSYIFDQLTSETRRMPNSLDIMAGFGNTLAKELMLNDFKESWSGMPDYPKKLKKIIRENDKMTEAQWKQNLYYYWLYNIKALYDIKDKSNLPFFMKTDGWDRKTLNTSLASWAELRHNTILFAKESVVAECGGDTYEENRWIPQPPQGYVEPNIEFYNRMASLMQFTIDGLKKRKMLSRNVENIGMEFIDLINFLDSIAHKELNNEKVTPEEYEQIQKVGSLVDNLTLRVLVGDYMEWWQVEGPDKNMPVIADVHTADGIALEVGVGKPQQIFVVVEIDGKLRLTRGAIFSYYEFPQSSSNRLNDEQWQELLNNNKAPKQPFWINYKSNKMKKLVPLYKPTDDTPDYSTTPGWNMVIYDTGC